MPEEIIIFGKDVLGAKIYILFSLILALLPLRLRGNIILSARTLPTLFKTTDSTFGEKKGKTLSTPMPSDILRTVNVAVDPFPVFSKHLRGNSEYVLFHLQLSYSYGDIISGFKFGMLLFSCKLFVNKLNCCIHNLIF